MGQPVVCNGAGGFGEYVTAKAASCHPVREASAEAVAVGLSGVTAAAAILVIESIRSLYHDIYIMLITN